ncbi:FHA domain-containing protein [Kitasatospora sp. NPDC056731]|uniref:FHA domain-containing protein n=1 Tax=Kitasatospora sp. NPDC056731 TaxID=3155422 RepID=UPI00342DEF38
MPICPRGHESQAEDWCDFCGFPMTPPAPPPPGAHQGAHGTHPGAYGSHPAPEAPGSFEQSQHPDHRGTPYGAPLSPPPVPPGNVPPQPGAMPPPPAQGYPNLTEGLTVCPICRSPQTGRFCEECGYDYELSTPSRRQPPPVGGPAYGGQAQPPLNIPAAYGGAPAAQPPTAQPPAAQSPYGHPPYGQLPVPQQPQPQHAQHPQQAAAPAHTYGYPPSLPANGPEGPTPEGAFPEAPVREDSGPVYAEPPGPNNRGGDFGTSFHLAPPHQQQPPPQQPQPAAPAEPLRANWIAVVSADREYFTEMMARSGPEAAGLFFPPYCPERRIPLTGRGQLRIGRRSQHRGTVPEIDLSVPPEDPGASHQHALLAEQADGSWVLVDQDSTNGTTVNGGAEPIAPHTAVPLNDGDRIHIGAWTTITVHRA